MHAIIETGAFLFEGEVQINNSIRFREIVNVKTLEELRTLIETCL